MNYLRNLPTEQAEALASLVPVQPGRVVSMALSKSEHCQMVLLSFGAGESVSEESYFGDMFYYVLSGSMRLELPDSQQTLSAGECISVPAHTLHAIGGGSAFQLLQITVQ